MYILGGIWNMQRRMENGKEGEYGFGGTRKISRREKQQQQHQPNRTFHSQNPASILESNKSFTVLDQQRRSLQLPINCLLSVAGFISCAAVQNTQQRKHQQKKRNAPADTLIRQAAKR
jgi:hypothetical protein